MKRVVPGFIVFPCVQVAARITHDEFSGYTKKWHQNTPNNFAYFLFDFVLSIIKAKARYVVRDVLFS